MAAQQYLSTESTPRARYIREHYRLEQTGGVWRAVSEHGGVHAQTGKTWHSRDVIEGPDRGEVTRQARCRWGHFNFEDEAQAFAEIFR
jgi:hypothetical protein